MVWDAVRLSVNEAWVAVSEAWSGGFNLPSTHAAHILCFGVELSKATSLAAVFSMTVWHCDLYCIWRAARVL